MLNRYFIVRILLFLLQGLPVFSQDAIQNPNTISIGTGAGFVDQTVLHFIENENYNTRRVIGPVYLKYERKVSSALGIGVNFCMLDMKGEISNSYYPTQTFNLYGYNLYMRLNYYLATRISWLQPYCGAGMGIRDYIFFSGGNYEWGDTKEFHTGCEITAGAKLRFSDFLGCYVELGLAKTWLQAGMNFKF